MYAVKSVVHGCRHQNSILMDNNYKYLTLQLLGVTKKECPPTISIQSQADN